MTVRAIFAVDSRWGIGKNGTLPWPKNTNDLKWFRECTLDSIVMMGRNTWDDPKLPKPLPQRYNIVVSNRNLETNDDRPNMVINRDAVEKYLKGIERDVWIIGGAQLLKGTIDFVEEVWVSRIEKDYNCDTFIHLDNKFVMFERHSYFDKNLYIEKYKRKQL